MEIFIRRGRTTLEKSIIKERDSSGRICNCREPYDEKLVQTLWRRRAKLSIDCYLSPTYCAGRQDGVATHIDREFPIANDTDSLGMTGGANSKFLTASICCVLNINIKFSVRVSRFLCRCSKTCKGLLCQDLVYRLRANSKYWLWLMTVCCSGWT